MIGSILRSILRLDESSWDFPILSLLSSGQIPIVWVCHSDGVVLLRQSSAVRTCTLNNFIHIIVASIYFFPFQVVSLLKDWIGPSGPASFYLLFRLVKNLLMIYKFITQKYKQTHAFTHTHPHTLPTYISTLWILSLLLPKQG